MPIPNESSRRFDRVVLLFLFGVLLFATPLMLWWAAPDQSWYLPYLLWGLLIALAAWLDWRGNRHDH